MKDAKKGYKSRIIEYDHTHNSPIDKGTPYIFHSAEQLLQDFLNQVNKIINELQEGKK